MSNPKLNIKEETSAKKTRSPPKKAKVEQTVPKKKKLKTDALTRFSACARFQSAN